jgi:hypothetical protein
MTRLIFIRHAATDCFQDRLAGRNVDVHLSAAGKIQGERLPGPAEPSKSCARLSNGASSTWCVAAPASYWRVDG